MSYALLWNFDLEIAVTDFNFQHGGNNLPVKDISWFESNQYGVYTPESNKKNNMLIKIDTLWEIYGDGKMLTVDPFYNYESTYRTVPGVVDPNKANNISVLLEPYSDTINIKKGNVACLFIPLNHADVKVVI